MTAFGSLKRSLFIPALSPLQGGRALPRLASPRPLENLWGQTAAQKIAAVAPSPQEPTAQHTAHDLPTCAVGLSHPGLASPGDRPEIGRGAGPAARALRKTNRGGAQRAGAGYDWLGCVGECPRAVGRGWSGRLQELRLLAVHLRADALVVEAGLATVSAAMSRFKVSKFRHTEARLPRREVSPVRGSRSSFPSPDPARGPPSRFVLRRPLQARDRCPGRPVVTRQAVSAAPGMLSGRLVSPAVSRPACLSPGPPRRRSPSGQTEAWGPRGCLHSWLPVGFPREP